VHAIQALSQTAFAEDGARDSKLLLAHDGRRGVRCSPVHPRFVNAARPRMLTTPGCTALHVVPANAQELISVILPFEDQLVPIQASILSLTGGDNISPPGKPLSSLRLAEPILVSCPYVNIIRSTCSPSNRSPLIFLPNGCGRCWQSEVFRQTAWYSVAACAQNTSQMSTLLPPPKYHKARAVRQKWYSLRCGRRKRKKL